MVMGGLVLTMDEVSPVMKKLVEGGIEVTALHNHLLRNQPFTCVCCAWPRQPREASCHAARRARRKQDAAQHCCPGAGRCATTH